MIRAKSAASVLWALALALAAQTSSAETVFILDPGHGGRDLGAVVGKLCEKDITLAIARKVKEKLATLGTSVRLTRDSDVYLPLDERVDDGERGTIFVSFHLNDVRSRRRQGITVYAFGRDRFRIPRRRRRHAVPPLAAPPAEERRESTALASTLVDSLRAKGFRVDAPARAGFYVLKNPDVPSVLIELGYLSNPKEAARLQDPAYQDKLAQALAVSLQSYALINAPPARPVQLQARAPSPARAGGSR